MRKSVFCMVLVGTFLSIKGLSIAQNAEAVNDNSSIGMNQEEVNNSETSASPDNTVNNSDVTIMPFIPQDNSESSVPSISNEAKNSWGL